MIDTGFVRTSRLIYDPYAGPIGPIPPGVAKPNSFFYDADKPFVRRIRRKPVDPDSTYVPLPIPGVPKPNSFFYDADKPQVRKLFRRRVDPDSTYVPLPIQGVAKPNAFFYDADKPFVRRLTRKLGRDIDPVLDRGPSAGIASTITAIDDGGTTRWSRLLYDPYAGPVGPMVPLTPTAYFFDVGKTEVRRKPKPQQQDIATALAFAPAGTTTPGFLASAYGSLIVRNQLVFQDEVTEAWSAAPVQGTAAPSTLVSPDEQFRARAKPKRQQLSSFVFAIPEGDIWSPAETDQPPKFKRKRAQSEEIIQPPQNVGGAQPVAGVAPLGSWALESPRITHSRFIYDPIAAPIPLPAPGTATPATLASVVSGLIVRHQIVFQADIAEPISTAAAPAGTATPSFLFDWTTSGRGPRISKIALADNDGTIWVPQEIAPAPPPEPEFAPHEPPTSSGTGGVWRPRHVLYRKKLKKRLEEELDELIEALESAPTQEDAEAAAAAIDARASLLDGLARGEFFLPDADNYDDDEEVIMILLEMLSGR